MLKNKDTQREDCSHKSYSVSLITKGSANLYIIQFCSDVSIESSQNLQRSLAIIHHKHPLEISVWHSDAKFIIPLVHVYTSHLGDSGMKKRPDINTMQSKVPASMASHTLGQNLFQIGSEQKYLSALFQLFNILLKAFSVSDHAT